ncbi:DUF268 domain-containing protein [Anaeromyxobacter dehalogenans]|nr:DUF268 domain-containing protein [Anaeromyxobacter dehalogenans]
MVRRAAYEALRRVAGAGAWVGRWVRFWRTYRDFDRLAPDVWRLDPALAIPRVGEDTATTPVDPIYFYQDAWAFQRIVAAHPPSHVDVGSHHKFVALLSRVVRLTMVDIRPLELPLDGLLFREGSILSLPFEDGSIPSLSSLCVIEHIGLGRYGDPLDPLGHEKAVAELKRVLARGGDLYVSVPVRDGNRVHFNAHRAFDEAYFLSLLAPLEVVDRAYIHGSRLVPVRPPRADAVGCYHLRGRG